MNIETCPLFETVYATLSPRAREWADGVLAGKTNPQIAAERYIPLTSIESYTRQFADLAGLPSSGRHHGTVREALPRLYIRDHKEHCHGNS